MKVYRQKPLISLITTLIQLTFLIWTRVQILDEGSIPDRPIAYIMTCNLGYPPSTKYAQPQKDVTSYIILLVIATSSDIEANPGPRQPKFPCRTCRKAVTWKQKGIRCDNSECQQWYHTNCQNMRSSNCMWECLQGAMPIFDLHSLTCILFPRTTALVNFLSHVITRTAAGAHHRGHR